MNVRELLEALQQPGVDPEAVVWCRGRSASSQRRDHLPPRLIVSDGLLGAVVYIRIPDPGTEEWWEDPGKEETRDLRPA